VRGKKVTKTAAIQNLKQSSIGALLCVSLLGNLCFGVFGQNNATTNRAGVRLTRAQDEFQAFARALPFARNAEFVKVLERELGAAETRTAPALIDERDEKFFAAVFAAHRKSAEKSARQRMEPNKIMPVKTTPKRTRPG
jgi:hypothetical protein